MKIELHELFSFYRHPQRHFFIQQLGIRFNQYVAKVEEREPFTVARLDGYSIYHDWIATLLNGNTVSVKKMQAQGQWPSGVVGELAFNQQQQKLVEFVQKIRVKNLGSPIDDLAVDFKIGKYHLFGKLENRYEHGNLLYRYAKLKGKDFVIALLHHLISNQLDTHCTHLLSDSDDLIFAPELAETEQLVAWLALYEQGQQHPHAFFVEAAFEYVKQVHSLACSKNAKVPAITKAEEQLAAAIKQDYEPELKLLSRNIREINQLLNQDFEQQCQQLLQTAWTATQPVKSQKTKKI
jgi:exodeoxyribonuclease V gamma subunit